MWQWLNDNGVGLSAVAAIATGIVAIWAIINAKLDSRDRSRPAIVAEFRISPDSETTILLVVRNFGFSVARSVDVRFEPELADDQGKPFGTGSLRRRFGQRIPTIAPGQELQDVWWSGGLRGGDTQGLTSGVGTPDEVLVKVSYTDDHDRAPYTDDFRLMVEPVRPGNLTVASNSIRGCMQAIAEQSAELTTVARSIAASLARSDDE